jgi:hypothetical protein
MVGGLGDPMPAPADIRIVCRQNHAMTEPIDPAGATTASHLARNLVSLRHTRALTQDGLAKGAGVPR